MYKINYYSPKDFNKLEIDWRRLETGLDMTYFQRYDWFKMLNVYVHRCRLIHESVYAEVRNHQGYVVLIAPLWILHHSFLPSIEPCGVYLMGRKRWADYLNFIYKEFDPEAVDYLLSELKHRFKLELFVPEQVRQDSAFYYYLQNNRHVYSDTQEVCVKLELPSSVGAYQKMLSKGTRQNLRTAYNRLEKEGHSIRFVFDDVCIDKNACLSLRSSRLGKKNYEPNFVARVKKYIIKLLTHKSPMFYPIKEDPNSHVMSAYVDGKLVAFFQYVKSQQQNSIMLMAVGTSKEYSRYSPGMLLIYEYILNSIDNSDCIDVVDFTRGNETYKYHLAGTEHYIHNLKVKL